MSPKDYDWSTWPGMEEPHFTQIPDDIFDVLMPHLSEAELRVLLYIARHTYGYKKSEDSISIGQMVNGITKDDGSRVDHGTGLSNSSVRRATKGLEEKGILIVERR